MKSNMKVVVVQPEEKLQSMPITYGALELEAAAALLMLRYQYDIKVAQTTTTTTMPPSPPPPPTSSSALLQPTGGVAAPAKVVVVKVDKCTPKEQVCSGNAVNPIAQPLKKRSIPQHLLRRSLTPAKSTPVANKSNSGSSRSGSSKSGSSRSGSNRSGSIRSGSGRGIIKAKLKVVPAAPCNKALLKSCRNMIREFLDNQELF
ncbi:GH10277 [Drosophila grimshawi]|uniref:GH10277 n=1 Tax=Drosophila grimshawi TaxID=7222 RepID=B4JAQ9_DROGR|nr:GH10277 [Drosophila grimshawi]